MTQLDVQEAVEREAEKHLMQTFSLGIEEWLNIQEGFLEEVTPELSLKARGGILRILKA